MPVPYRRQSSALSLRENGAGGGPNAFPKPRHARPASVTPYFGRATQEARVAASRLRASLPAIWAR